MSDRLAKVAGMTELPIFPLPLVLLPNELLPLHIFEDRYRKMLADVEQEGKLFGINLFEGVVDETGPRPPAVGCAAEIREVETLADGRSNILTFGLVRYRLIGYIESEEPYLVGDVEFFEDETGPAANEAETAALADEVFVLFERMAKAAFKISGGRGQFPEIQRTDPESLSFLVTAAFNFDNQKKYELLETDSTFDRLTELRLFLNGAVQKIEETADIQAVSKTNGHSKKKLDI